MFRGFVFGVLATMVVALVGGYFALSNGSFLLMPTPPLRGWKHGQQEHRWRQLSVVRPRIPILSR